MGKAKAVILLISAASDHVMARNAKLNTEVTIGSKPSDQCDTSSLDHYQTDGRTVMGTWKCHEEPTHTECVLQCANSSQVGNINRKCNCMKKSGPITLFNVNFCRWEMASEEELICINPPDNTANEANDANSQSNEPNLARRQPQVESARVQAPIVIAGNHSQDNIEFDYEKFLENRQQRRKERQERKKQRQENRVQHMHKPVMMNDFQPIYDNEFTVSSGTPDYEYHSIEDDQEENLVISKQPLAHVPSSERFRTENETPDARDVLGETLEDSRNHWFGEVLTALSQFSQLTYVNVQDGIFHEGSDDGHF